MSEEHRIERVLVCARSTLVPRLLAHYAVFYMFGALLFSARGVGFRVGRRGYVALVVSLALYPFGLAVMGLWNEGDALGRFVNDSFGEMGLARSVVGYGAQALIAWCAVFGLIGVCERLLSRERWWVRYVSDSSYWLYLAHLPLVMALQRLLLGVEAPGLVKFAVIVVVTTGSLLVTYRWCVRYGWIGTLLNGPRERAGGRAKGSG